MSKLIFTLVFMFSISSLACEGSKNQAEKASTMSSSKKVATNQTSSKSSGKVEAKKNKN